MNILIEYMQKVMNKFNNCMLKIIKHIKNLINKIKNYFVKKNVKSKKVTKKS